jgi:SAM-dependent methyltransferase
MPKVVDTAADAAFRAQAVAMGYDPDNRWVGGYVPVAWEEVRHLIGAYAGDVGGAALLEFGCNYAASSIVAAAMGARVTGVDVDADAIALARCNAARHGFADRVDLCHVADTRRLPFDDASFDIILCISVLEYVAPGHLPAVLTELRRVLKPGGLMIVSGTASRLAPREVHSRRWLVNYWPRAIDRWLLRRKEPLQRGVNPLTILRAFRDWENLDRTDHGARWCKARATMGQSSAKLQAARLVAALTRPFGLSIGMAGSSFSATWRKPN